MLNKIFNSSNFETTDLSNFHYLRPKRIHQEGPSPAISRVYYEEDGKRMNVCFETDTFNLTNGIQKTPSGIHYVDFNFNGNDTFFDFINMINELNINKTYENSKKWFNKQIDLDLIDNYYKYPLRADRRTRENFIRLRVDVENLNIYNQYGKNLDLDNVCSNVKTKICVRFDGIQILRQNFFPLFNISEITVFEKKKFVDNQEFLDEDNGLPNLLDTNVNYEETEQEILTVGQSLRNANLLDTNEQNQEHQSENQNETEEQPETEEQQETENQETEQLETEEQQETENQETEQLETEEQQETENQETENQEIEQLETEEQQEMENQETENQETEQLETEEQQETNQETENQETEEDQDNLENKSLENESRVNLDGFLKEQDEMLSSDIKRRLNLPQDEQTELIEFFKDDNEEELTRKTQRLVQTLLRRQNFGENTQGSETSSKRIASVSIRSGK